MALTAPAAFADEHASNRGLAVAATSYTATANVDLSLGDERWHWNASFPAFRIGAPISSSGGTALGGTLTSGVGTPEECSFPPANASLHASSNTGGTELGGTELRLQIDNHGVGAEFGCEMSSLGIVRAFVPQEQYGIGTLTLPLQMVLGGSSDPIPGVTGQAQITLTIDCPPQAARAAQQGCQPDPCAPSSPDTNPLSRSYINQYDVGQETNLPTSSVDAKRGANACGVSSLIMGINSLKARAGVGTMADSARYPGQDLRSLYEATASAPKTGDGVSSGFAWAQGEAVAQSMGYQTESHGFAQGTEAFLDNALANGAPVIVSTTFSRTGNVGGGHVVLVRERTPAGDYVVDDPAGNQNVAGGYGPGQCGHGRTYPRDLVRSRIKGRPALAVLPTPGADPRVAVILAPKNAPEHLWVRDSRGRRTGWTPNGVRAEIPRSSARSDPLVPSDPAAGPTPPRFRRAIIVRRAPSRLDVEVSADSARRQVRLVQVQGGALVADVLVRNLRGSRRLDLAPPRSRITHRPGRRSRKVSGSVVAPGGLRRVEYALKDQRGGYFVDARGRRAQGVPSIATKAKPASRPGHFTWSAKVPRRLVVGRRYRIYVRAIDSAGNQEVIVTSHNRVSFTLSALRLGVPGPGRVWAFEAARPAR